MSISNEGGGEFLGGASNGDEWSDIDQEWLELQEQMGAQEHASGDVDDAIDIVAFEVSDKFDEYNLPRVIDNDPRMDMQLGLQFLDNYRDRKIEERKWSAEGISEVDITFICIEALKAYKDRRDAEDMVLFCSATYRLVKIRQGDGGTLDDETLHEIKSELLSVFEVHYKLEPEWLQFFHDMTSDDRESAPYYEAMYDNHRNMAWQSLPAFEKEKASRWRILDEALVVAGVNLYEDDLEDILGTAGALMDMQTDASVVVRTEAEHANRNERIWEHGREANLGSAVIKKLADFFERTYPLQG